jgi:hypothetical protein
MYVEPLAALVREGPGIHIGNEHGTKEHQR